MRRRKPGTFHQVDGTAISAYEKSLSVDAPMFGVTYEEVERWAEEEVEKSGFARGYHRALARATNDEEIIKLTGMVLVKMGEAYRLSGNSAKAIEIFDTIEKQTPPYSEDILGLARCGKARVLLANGDLENASKACRVDEALLKTTEDLALRSEVSSMYDSIGDIAYQTGQNSRAIEAYDNALMIRRRLVKADKSNLRWRLDLARSDLKVGDWKYAQREGSAIENYREAYKTLDQDDPFGTRDAYHEERGFWLPDFLAVVRSLAKAEPDNPQWAKELRVLNEISEGKRYAR
jgi:tetratricopeptide (TPR) repeat protein